MEKPTVVNHPDFDYVLTTTEGQDRGEQDTVLVLSQTLLDAENKDTSEYSMDRRATYVYRRVADKWLCAIDNSYGTTLLD